ncbi:MAG: phosphotransferase [Nitrolancea sp.]
MVFSTARRPRATRVCHHDLSPKNTVFREGRAIAFIDWDLATAEAPIHDVVHAAWQFAPLATDEACRELGWSPLPDHGRRLRLLLDAYGLALEERLGFAARVAERMEITASGIEALATEGHSAFQRMVSDGIPTEIRCDRAWVLAHGRSLDAALQS